MEESSAREPIEVPEEPAAADAGAESTSGAGAEGQERDGQDEAAAEATGAEDQPVEEEDEYAYFTHTALRDELRHLRRDVSALARENELLAFFVSHRLGDGEDLASLQAAGGGELVAAGEARARLSQAQLLDVAKGCREDVRADAALAKERALGALSTLQVVVTQAGLRLAGVRAQSLEFGAAVQRGRSERTGAVTAEAIVKFYEDSLRKRRARTEKLAWKTSVLQRELDKMRGSSKAVSDSSSELVRYITFHQLRIENSQFTAKLAAKSRDLLKLKMISGYTSDLVIKLKAELAQSTRSITELRASIKDRSALTAKVAGMQATVDRQLAQLRGELVVNEQRSQDAADMPSILDYINLVRTQRLLGQELAQVGRKQEVGAGDAGTPRRSSSSSGRGGGGQRSASAGGALGGRVGGGQREGEDSVQPLPPPPRAASGSGAAAARSNPAYLASAALTATGLGGSALGSSCTLPAIAGTRPMGTAASVSRVLYAAVGTGSAAPAPSALRRSMPAKAAVEAAEAMGGRALGGGGLVAPLLRSVTGGGPLPRGVAGFAGAMASSLGKLGGGAGGAPVLSKLHLGRAALKGSVARGAGSGAVDLG